MAKKVVPGSITEPYKVGQGDFSPNLVGQQFTQGTPLFTLGNFTITTNISGSDLSTVYQTGNFSDTYTLETLNLTEQESEMLSNQSLEIKLNLDTANLERFVYFGSFYEFISSTIKNILINWKGSLYVNPYIPNDISGIPRNTVLNYSYNTEENISYITIPVVTIINKFGLVYESQYGGGSSQESPIFNPSSNLGDMFNLNIDYEKYQLSNIYGDFYVKGFTGSTSTKPYINIAVKGSPWPGLETIGFGIFDYHIRPKEEYLNKFFFNNLNEFEGQVLNRLTNPKYTYSLKITKKTEEGFTFLSEKKFTWPTSDGYNIDNGGGEFTSYLNSWLNAAKDLDEYRTDLIARRFITSSIIEFDTDVGDGDDVYGRKVNKLLRIYGREFDEIKKHIDSLSFSRIVEYDKKDNTPDAIIKMLASELGFDVLLSFFDNNLFNNETPQNSGTEGYGNLQLVPFSGYSRNLSTKEMDIELWRRLVINAWWLFKSKGHRKVLEFFLSLFGIQKCVVSLDEYVYIAKDAPLDVDETLNMVYQNSNIQSGTTIWQMDEYGFPSLLPNSDDYYYQLNGFWYNGGNLSEVGNNPHTGPYDYGQFYLDRLRCFVDGFSGVTTGVTTFTTIDNLFTDYENGTIENGLPNYGENYAEIMNQNNRVTPSLNVLLAGSDDTITYDESKQSFRITFNLSTDDCTLPCPLNYINYENGLIFIGLSTPPIEEATNTSANLINQSEIPLLFQSDPERLINAATISEICCTEAGGYYLPIGIDENPLGSDTFTPEELFSLSEEEVDQNFGCYWCPPTYVICGIDYYNNLNGPSLRQEGAGPVGGGGGDFDTGIYCTKPVGQYVYEGNYRYLIVSPPTALPPQNVIPIDPDYLGDQWTDVTTTTGLLFNLNNLFQRGLCYGVRSEIPTDDGGGIQLVDNNTLLGPGDLATNPCFGEVTQSVDGTWLINGGEARPECCTENVIGFPVTVNELGKCVNLFTDVEDCPQEIIIDGDIVITIENQQCCSRDVVGSDVFWDGENCRIINEDFCVLLSTDGQNITNEECCSLKGGYLSTDLNGNIICLQNSIIIETESCSLIELNNVTTESIYNDDNTTTVIINDSNGNSLSKVCCTEYRNLFNDPSVTYDPVLGICSKTERNNLVACRYDLIEGFFGRVSNFHLGSDLGINSLHERIYLKIITLKINGVDYLNNNVIQTIIDPSIQSPNYWNSVLFLQKTINDLNINNFKVQLPGKPFNVDQSVPDTQGLITANYPDGYGFYILRPENTIFEIDVQFFTHSDQPGNFNTPPGVFTFNLTENNQTLNNQFSPKVRKTECGYKVNVEVNTSDDTCYTIINDGFVEQLDGGFGEEPTQCYPYTINGNTYN